MPVVVQSLALSHRYDHRGTHLCSFDLVPFLVAEYANHFGSFAAVGSNAASRVLFKIMKNSSVDLYTRRSGRLSPAWSRALLSVP